MWVRSAFSYLPKTNLGILTLCHTFQNVTYPCLGSEKLVKPPAADFQGTKLLK